MVHVDQTLNLVGEPCFRPEIAGAIGPDSDYRRFEPVAKTPDT